MLITFSGIVGSGKSTSSKYVRDFLVDQNLNPLYVRFRFLTWNWPKMKRKAIKKGRRSSNIKRQKREKPFRCEPMRRLGFLRFAGYAIRMVNFHLFHRFMLNGHLVICDRFFYDNLVHYKLEGKAERIYFRILTKFMPKADLSFLMLADPEIIIQRRESYEPNYIRELHAKYTVMSDTFCDLQLMRTDDPRDVLDVIERQIRERLNGKLKG